MASSQSSTVGVSYGEGLDRGRFVYDTDVYCTPAFARVAFVVLALLASVAALVLLVTGPL